MYQTSNITASTQNVLDNALLESLNILSQEELSVSNWQMVVDAAIRFKNGWESLRKKSGFVRLQQFLTSNLENQSAAQQAVQAWEGQKKGIIRMRAKYTLAFAFDAVLKAYLGQRPSKAAIVLIDKQTATPKTIEISMLELANRGQLHRRISMAGLSSVNSYLENEEFINKKAAQMHVKKIQMAYKLTAERFKGKGQSRYIYYYNRNLGKYSTGYLNNLGDLKEAYVAALFSSHASQEDAFFSTPTNEEDLIRVMYEEYARKVDNVMAVVSEDVVTDETQYAVKGEGAALPMFGQYIALAESIVNGRYTGSTIQEHLNELRQKGSFRNTIQQQYLESEQAVLKWIEQEMQQRHSS